MYGKIVLVGEPMGLFIAKEEGELSEVENFSSSIAGAEYNVAVGLSRLGHRVAYCTKLGNDPFGDKIIEGLKKNGISTDLVMRTDESTTGFMMKGKTSVGDPKIAYFRKGSAASTISTHDIDRLDLFECEYLHVTGVFPAVSSSACNAVKRLVKRACDLDMKISFDPNLRPQLWKSEKEMVDTLNSFAQRAQTVLPGIAEGKILTGSDKPEKIAEFYHKLGVKNVVVKLGEKGAYYSCASEGDGIVPGFRVNNIVDTVGAGDGFAAGVISALAEGLSLKEACNRGNAIGAIQLTSVSDNEGLPTREELEAVLKKGEV